jgi:hypothetical protein
MGFLKELFQKKLHDATAGTDALKVQGRVQSEYSLPAFRMMQPSSAAADGEAG